ncbi:MAG: hypothetical protein AAGF68_02330 [Pseudomonadota bacterium]
MHGIVKTAFVVCVAFFVALRVVAHPLILSAPGPGLVALCTNGQIIYISLETGKPVQTETGQAEIACPYAGLNALGNEGPPVVQTGDIRGSVSGIDFLRDQVTAERRSLAHAVRAPPLFI